MDAVQGNAQRIVIDLYLVYCIALGVLAGLM
jgi:hypothetical protein